MDGSDVSSLYLDDGYLAFNIDAVETAVDNDSIDLEMRVFEGPQFTIDKVIIKGNDRTNEYVIRRELYTKPDKNSVAKTLSGLKERSSILVILIRKPLVSITL